MPSERPVRRGRWRMLTGWSIVMGTVAVLLTAERQRAEPETRGDTGRMEGANGQGDASGAVGRGRAESPPGRKALKDGYEDQDADPRTIGLIMVVGVSVIAVAITGLFVLLGILHAKDAGGPPLTVQQRALIAPPGPPLQSSPQDDLVSLTSLETKKLQGYRWLDARRSRAQIPIDRAMALVAGKPLDPVP